MDFKSFATDVSKEEQGVWVNLGPSSKILVARMGNRNFVNARKIKMRPYEALERLGKVSEETQEQVLCELVAETVLLGWEGFTENGEPVPYSHENALRVLQENKEFLAFVIQVSMDVENFRPAKKDTEKNLQPSSNGN